jgi:hypothetical protein
MACLGIELQKQLEHSQLHKKLSRSFQEVVKKLSIIFAEANIPLIAEITQKTTRKLTPSKY